MGDIGVVTFAAMVGAIGAVALPIVRGKYALTARDLRRAIQSDVPAMTAGLAVASYFLVTAARHHLWAVIVVSPMLGLIGAETAHALREYWPWRRG